MIRLVAVAAALLFSASAQAQQFSQSTGTNSYFSARLGTYLPQDDDLEGFDSGFEGEVAVGRYLNRNLAAELGVGFFTTGDEASFYDPDLGFIDAEVTMRAIPVTGSLRAIAPLEGLTLSAIVGVGIYNVRSEIKATSDLYGSATESDSGTTFGFHLGAGAGVQLSPTTTLGVELRYVVAETEAFDADVGLNGLRLGAALAFGF